MDTCCAVCAETLVFCAFGPCHHQEVCSKCMARLRLLDKNMSCAICREECPIIFVTRFMDDHTLRIPQDRWQTLKEEASNNPREQSLLFMKKISAVFDDSRHYHDLLHASSLTHPMLEAKTDVAKLHIKNLHELRRVVSTHLSMSFCDLCLKNRPVFTSEQVLYTKAGLAQHKDKGDDKGPMKEANFKGHPKCSFCKTHFYDQTEQFKHMEKYHYNCHLCRRENPDNYKYFKDYQHLEEHFEEEHHPCPFPQCRANKFVVFSNEAELQKHALQMHKDDVSMKRHERRSALQLETGFTTGRSAGRGRGQGGYEEEPAFQTVQRPPTVIGGGGAGAIDMRRRANEEEEEARRVAAQQRAQPLDISAEEHFPGLSQGPSQVPLGAQWGRGGGVGSSRAMQAAFPSLADSNPLSKGMKKKLKAKIKRSDGGVVRMGRPEDAPPAHLMQLGAEQAGSAYSADADAADDTGYRIQEEEEMPGGWVAPAGRAGSQPGHVSSSAAAAPVYPPPGTLQSNAFSGLVEDAEGPPPGLGRAPPSGSQSQEADADDQQQQQAARGSDLWYGRRLGRLPADGSQGSAVAGDVGGGASFPALGGAKSSAVSSSGPATGAAPLQARQGWITLGKKKPAAPVAAAAEAPALSSAAAFPTLSGPSGEVKFRGRKAAHEEQRAADAVMTEMKAKLSPGQFRTLKACTAELASGSISAQNFHAAIVNLGLTTCISQLMGMCPSDIRRQQVMAVHEQFLLSGALEAEQAERWEPPEAVRAAAQSFAGASAAAPRTWKCAICTLINDADVESCNACNTSRVVTSVHEAEESAAAAASALGRANIMSSGKKKKAKKVTMSFQDVNRATSSLSSAWGQR